MNNKCRERLFAWAASVAVMTGAPFATAADRGDEPVAYTERGADTCLKCHDEDDPYPVYSIFDTRHAVISDERAPFAGLQCEACHGAGAEHARRVGSDERQAPIMSFKRDSPFDRAVQNEMCLNCHDDHSRLTWQGSAHERTDVMCSDCHTVHVRRDPVLHHDQQAEVCYACHTKERSELLRASAHPVYAGVMACSSCHDAHDSWTDGLLIRATLNETCFECHAEKRGPYLWEHAPVTEDCSACHLPHGSNHDSLLKRRAPLLCQQCHSQAGHPSFAWDGGGLADGPDVASRQYLLGQSCANCHTQIHGSNHPSGVKLMR